MKTLLVLEDDPSVMKFLRQVLKRFIVISVTTGEEAIQAFANRDSPTDLLIADVRLPGLSGIQVALHFRSLIPVFPVVLMSGYLADGWREADIFDRERLGSQRLAILQKPFASEALLTAVYSLTEAPKVAVARTA